LSNTNTVYLGLQLSQDRRDLLACRSFLYTTRKTEKMTSGTLMAFALLAVQHSRAPTFSHINRFMQSIKSFYALVNA